MIAYPLHMVKAKFKVPLEHAFQLLMETSKEFVFELYRFCDVDDDGRVSGQEIDSFEKLLTWSASSTSMEGAEDEGGEEKGGEEKENPGRWVGSNRPAVARVCVGV